MRFRIYGDPLVKIKNRPVNPLDPAGLNFTTLLFNEFQAIEPLVNGLSVSGGEIWVDGEFSEINPKFNDYGEIEEIKEIGPEYV